MSAFRRIRSALRGQPRWMLVALLAFAIETLPPPSALVAHRHADGGVAHTHVGPIAGSAGAIGERAGGGIVRAASSDWHQHVAQPAVAVRGPAALPLPPRLPASELAVAPVPAGPAVVVASGQARSPPALDA